MTQLHHPEASLSLHESPPPASASELPICSNTTSNSILTMPEFEELKPVDSKTDYELKSRNNPKKKRTGRFRKKKPNRLGPTGRAQAGPPLALPQCIPETPVRTDQTPFQTDQTGTGLRVGGSSKTGNAPNRLRVKGTALMPKRARVNGHPVRANNVIETEAVPEGPRKKGDRRRPDRRSRHRGPARSKATGHRKPPAPKGLFDSILSRLKSLFGIKEPEPEKPKQTHHRKRRRGKNYRPNKARGNRPNRPSSKGGGSKRPAGQDTHPKRRRPRRRRRRRGGPPRGGSHPQKNLTGRKAPSNPSPSGASRKKPSSS